MLGRIEAHQHVKFTEGSRPLAEATSWRGGEAVATWLGEGSRTPCLPGHCRCLVPSLAVAIAPGVDRSDWTRGFSWETPERIGGSSWTGVAAHQRSVQADECPLLSITIKLILLWPSVPIRRLHCVMSIPSSYLWWQINLQDLFIPLRVCLGGLLPKYSSKEARAILEEPQLIPNDSSY
jgi:hypothetical protein